MFSRNYWQYFILKIRFGQYLSPAQRSSTAGSVLSNSIFNCCGSNELGIDELHPFGLMSFAF